MRVNFRLDEEEHPQLAQVLNAAANRRGGLTRRIIELAEQGLVYELQTRGHAVPSVRTSPPTPQREPGRTTGTGDLDPKLKGMADEFD